jgi:glycosyltransferase involved in cell wall biosynthesis
MSKVEIEPLISLILPVYNEEKCLSAFFTAVDSELSGLKLELVFVDDGSTDATFKLLSEKIDNRIRIVRFSRNFGKEAALTAGLNRCSGDVAIPFDVDLQDPIEIIHALLTEWKKGFLIVHGVWEERQDNSFLRRFLAQQYYRMFDIISDLKMVPQSGDFRLLDRKVIEALRTLPERVRFMKGLFNYVGFSSSIVKYKRSERNVGSSKFNFFKLAKFGLDGLISFSSLPIRIWSGIGMLIACPALVFMAVIVIQTLIFGKDVPGYASIISIILFLGGAQLITLGIMGEYIARIFTEVKQRPVYIVEEEYGFTNDAE